MYGNAEKNTATVAQNAKKQISDTLAILYVAKTSIGAGILFVPACYARLGLIPGLVITIAGAFVTAMTALWVARSAVSHQTQDYVMLVGLMIPSLRWRRMIEASITLLAVLMSMSSLVVYLRIVSETALVYLSSRYSREDASLMLLAVILPLSCIRSTSRLSWVSLGGILGMCYLLGIITIDLFRDLTFARTHAFNLGSNALSSVASIMFAYASQFWMPQVALEMRSGPSFLIFSGTLIAMIAYLLMGVGGYVCFGDSIRGLPIIQAFATSETPLVYRIAQLCLSTVYLLSFPLKIAPLRVSVRRVFLSAKSLERSEVELSSIWWEMAESTVLISMVVAISRWAPANTLKVFDLAASLASAPLALILPALMSVRLCGDRFGFRAVFCIFLGLALMGQGVWTQLSSFFTK